MTSSQLVCVIISDVTGSGVVPRTGVTSCLVGFQAISNYGFEFSFHEFFENYYYTNEFMTDFFTFLF